MTRYDMRTGPGKSNPTQIQRLLGRQPQPGRYVLTSDEDWDELECEAAKEVWLPSPELSRFLDARAALVDAGYRVLTARMYREHPVWSFFLDYSYAPRVGSHDELPRHIRDVLWEIGLRYFDEDAIVQEQGRNRIHFSILWRVPPSVLEREMAWEWWPLQDLLDQLP